MVFYEYEFVSTRAGLHGFSLLPDEMISLASAARFATHGSDKDSLSNALSNAFDALH